MIIHIPLTALFLIAFTCTIIGAGLAGFLMALEQEWRRRPLAFEIPKPIQPRRVVRQWDEDGAVE
jgi:hypothetical protein